MQPFRQKLRRLFSLLSGLRSRISADFLRNWIRSVRSFNWRAKKSERFRASHIVAAWMLVTVAFALLPEPSSDRNALRLAAQITSMYELSEEGLDVVVEQLPRIWQKTVGFAKTVRSNAGPRLSAAGRWIKDFFSPTLQISVSPPDAGVWVGDNRYRKAPRVVGLYIIEVRHPNYPSKTIRHLHFRDTVLEVDLEEK